MSRREVRVPKWGLTVETITIVEWKVEVGDSVSAGDALADVDTDKASSTIEAPAAGRIVELVAPAGKDCEVGEVIAILESEAEDGKSAGDGA